MARVAYSMAGPEVTGRVEALVEQFHTRLAKADVTFDLIEARCEDDDKVPLKLHGYRALAIVRIVPLKDRVAGRADAEITFDAAAYDKMGEARRNALFDHELTHLNVVERGLNVIARDDHGRPKLEMRRHDYHFGWFTEVAKRWGVHSWEVTQAKELWDEAGQAYFPFAEGMPGVIDEGRSRPATAEDAFEAAAEKFTQGGGFQNVGGPEAEVSMTVNGRKKIVLKRAAKKGAKKA